MSSEIELRIIPAEGVTDRYAAASGDNNPIHLDDAFAASVGLPGRILHGLWTAAQVARAATSAAPDGPVVGEGAEARYALESLKLTFRGMALIGPEVRVSGSVTPPTDDGSIAVKLDVTQDGTRLIRAAVGQLRAS